MVEQIQKKVYKGWRDYPYKDDPLFEYVNMVADHFWWVKQPKDNDPNDCEIAPSNVPTIFAERYLSNMINLDRLPMYLAVTNKPFKHLKFDDIDRIANEKVRKNPSKSIQNISANLKAYNLDISKFWYLCICIKDYVEGQTKKGCLLFYPSLRREILNLIGELDLLNVIERPNYIISNEDKLFELNLRVKHNSNKVNGKNVWNSTRVATLTIIKTALKEYLDKHSDNSIILDIREIDVNSKVMFLKKDLGETIKVALFCRYLGWFLSQRKLDKDFANNYYQYVSSKNLLITRMVYLTGLSDKKEFLNGNNDYALTYCSKSKDVDVNTNNKFYGLISDEVINALSSCHLKNGNLGII